MCERTCYIASFLMYFYIISTDNRCLMQLAKCEGSKTGHYIGYAHSGECTDKDVNCPRHCDSHIEPVCSTGNVTFSK